MNPLLVPFLVCGLLFTFDDGPSIKNTPKILNLLKKYKVKAVFCWPGGNLRTKKQIAIAKRAIKEGHLLCNHSYNHPNFRKLSKGSQWWQILHTQYIYRKHLKYKPVFFRAPFCLKTRYMYKLLRKYNMKLLPCGQIDTRDWSRKTSAQMIYNRVIRGWNYRWKKRGKNSIVLFHDTNGKTTYILEKILKKITSYRKKVTQIFGPQNSFTYYIYRKVFYS